MNNEHGGEKNSDSNGHTKLVLSQRNRVQEKRNKWENEICGRTNIYFVRIRVSFRRVGVQRALIHASYLAIAISDRFKIDAFYPLRIDFFDFKINFVEGRSS